MVLSRGRLVRTNALVFDQGDFFQPDGFTRVPGLVISDLTCRVFFNNLSQVWPLVTGGSTPDARVASGSVYWSEIPGSPGFYSVRFRPNAEGFWRLVLTYPAGTQTVGLDFDVLPLEGVPTGLTPSFVHP